MTTNAKIDPSGKTERILSMADRLLRGQSITKKAEAQRFGVNEKSIQRDLDDLRIYFGQSLESQDRRELMYDWGRKVYRLDQPAQRLRDDQIYLLAKVALDSRAFATGEMNQMLDRLMEQADEVSRPFLQEVIRNERFHYAPVAGARPLGEQLWALSVAVKRQQLIRIAYTRVNEREPLEVMVEPMGVMFSEYYFYLIARIGGEDRGYPICFRLDRIRSYDVTNERFTVPYRDRFEEGVFRKQVQFMQAGQLMRLRFRFWGRSLEAVLDRLPNAVVIEETSAGTIIEAEVFGRGVKMWLLSQAEFVEVISPADFREEMQRTVRQMLGIYD